MELQLNSPTLFFDWKIFLSSQNYNRLLFSRLSFKGVLGLAFSVQLKSMEELLPLCFDADLKQYLTLSFLGVCEMEGFLLLDLHFLSDWSCEKR